MTIFQLWFTPMNFYFLFYFLKFLIFIQLQLSPFSPIGLRYPAHPPLHPPPSLSLSMGPLYMCSLTWPFLFYPYKLLTKNILSEYCDLWSPCTNGGLWKDSWVLRMASLPVWIPQLAIYSNITDLKVSIIKQKHIDKVTFLCELFVMKVFYVTWIK